MTAVEWDPGRFVTTTVVESGERVVLLAHGAGTDQSHRMITGIRDALAAAGVSVVTFDYPYTAEGRGRPDRAEVLLRCHRAVLDWTRSALGEEVVVAGRSMGGRMATHLAAEHAPCAGVVLYAYPLHPAGKPDKLRIAHLGDITVPMLFFQADRDALSRADLFDAHIRPLARITVIDMPGADHSFRGKDWPPDRLYPFLAEETAAWIRANIPEGRG